MRAINGSRSRCPHLAKGTPQVRFKCLLLVLSRKNRSALFLRSITSSPLPRIAQKVPPQPEISGVSSRGPVAAFARLGKIRHLDSAPLGLCFTGRCGISSPNLFENRNLPPAVIAASGHFLAPRLATWYADLRPVRSCVSVPTALAVVLSSRVARQS